MANKINLVSISADDLADLLTKVGSTSASRAEIDRHIAAGAPVNKDGTINLIYFTAWLVREYLDAQSG